MHNEYEFWSAFAPYVARGGGGFDMARVAPLELVSTSARAGVKAALAVVDGRVGRHFSHTFLTLSHHFAVEQDVDAIHCGPCINQSDTPRECVQP
jgi:hypothetical protein